METKMAGSGRGIFEGTMSVALEVPITVWHSVPPNHSLTLTHAVCSPSESVSMPGASTARSGSATYLRLLLRRVKMSSRVFVYCNWVDTQWQ
jgi:hypothetical protein